MFGNENIAGTCKECRESICIDEGYKTVGSDSPFPAILCIDCYCKLLQEENDALRVFIAGLDTATLHSNPLPLITRLLDSFYDRRK